ncbi:MAG: sugar phosphate isomerase/epimerase family protein [Anaerolineae bacterium]
MAVACSSGTFHQLPLEAALRGIRKMGFKRVDLLAIGGWCHISPAEAVADVDKVDRRLQKALDATGLELDAFNMGFSPALHDRGADARSRRQEEAAAMAELMTRYHLTTASLVPGQPDPDLATDVLVERSIASLREIMAIMRPLSLTICLECHVNSVMEDPSVAAHILDAVPGLMVAYDPSHLIMQQIPLENTAALLERTERVHLRDAAPGEMQVRWGRGELDLDRLLELLGQHGYTGGYSIEVLDPWGSRAAREDAIALRNALAEKGVG